MTRLAFNHEATGLIQARPGSKLRVEIKDGALRVRPTDRKAGPHVLVEYQAFGKGVAVAFDDKQIERLAAGNMLTNATSFHVVKDKYGWFILQEGEAPEGVEHAGAKVTVSQAA